MRCAKITLRVDGFPDRLIRKVGNKSMKQEACCKIDRGIATITIDSPPVNAFSEELQRQFITVIGGLKKVNPRVVIITGSDRYFQTGGDMNRFLQIKTLKNAQDFVEMAQTFMDDIAELPCTTIAAINGFALGGGLEIALACDIRIASSRAVMGLPEVRYGILPGAGGTQRLSRLIGTSMAKLLIYTGRHVTASEAYNLGLVDVVVEPEHLINECFKVAEEILPNSQAAIESVKRCIDEGINLPLKDGLVVEREYWVKLIEHGDYKEGVRAWLEKRRPNFPPR